MGQWLLWAAVKVWLFGYPVFANFGTQQVFFWVLTVIITVAFVRRFGPITLFESAIVMFFWTLAGLFLDLILTSKFTGLGIFSTQAFWDSYGVMIAAVFVFHKKRHIHVRKRLHAAKHHAALHHSHANQAHVAQQAGASYGHGQMPEIKR